MYFVDRKLIEERLAYIEKCMTTFSETDSWAAHKDQLALERLIHVVIESIIDVGTQMIDGFIMRDPGGYADIIRVLEDESVISTEEATPLVALMDERKKLVRDYSHLDHDGLYDIFKNSESAVTHFPGNVRQYIDDELGPISAFVPEDDKGETE